MKKLIIAIVVLLASVGMANAQERVPVKHQPGFNNPGAVSLNTDYAYLLNNQNRLLQNRKVALTLSIAGGAVAGIGSSVLQMAMMEEDGNPTPGAIITAVGGTCALVGGIWTMINEFKLIESQKKINDNLLLRFGPGGVALQF